MKLPQKKIVFLILIPFFLTVFSSFYLFNRLYLNTNDANNGQFDNPSFIHDKYLNIRNNKLYIEIANTSEKRRLGLSGRNYLANNEGMLFDFNIEDTYRTFWMKDMIIPIDIIWIDDDRVVQIDKNLLPPKEDTPYTGLVSYKSKYPIDYVLEVNANYSDKHDIKIGDKIELYIK